MGKLWEPGERYYPVRINGKRKSPFGDSKPGGLGRKILRQTVTAFLFFLLIWGLFSLESPLAAPAQGRIRGWFSEDYSIEPVIKFFTEVGLWGDTFDRAAFEAMQYPQGSEELSLAVPVSGQIARSADKNGILIAAAENSAIKAAAAGKVTRIANEEQLGRVVEISDESGLSASYGHCAEILVNLNEKVLRGQVIARVGQTGNAPYPQLYFQLVRKGEVLDPVELLLPEDVRT